MTEINPRFRTIFPALVPSWLSSDEGDGARLHYTWGALQDVELERLRQGRDAHCPTRARPSALVLLGSDRRILRGRVETDSQYAERLIAWRLPRTHRVRGNALEAITQIWHYFNTHEDTDSSVIVGARDMRGQVTSIAADGTETVGGAGSWDWDSTDHETAPVAGASSGTSSEYTLTLTVPARDDGTRPAGDLLFLQVANRSLADVTASGWVAVYDYTGVSHRHHVLVKLSDADEVEAVATREDGEFSAMVGRAYRVPAPYGVPWHADAARNVHEIVERAESSGSATVTSGLTDAPWATNLLTLVAFPQATTLSAFAGSTPTWTDAAAEATEGTTTDGVGVSLSYAFTEPGQDSSDTATLGASCGWDSVTLRLRRPWARFWITIGQAPGTEFFTTQPDFGDPDLWGGTLGTTGYSIGLTGWTYEDTLSLRRLFQGDQWNPVATVPEWLVIGGSADLEPDGTYRHWSVNTGTPFFYQVAARDRTFRYVSLSPDANNRYAGNAESFAGATEMPDSIDGGGDPVYGGDDTSTAAWDAITLPNGETYAGNAESFPADTLLLDDGAQPQ